MIGTQEEKNSFLDDFARGEKEVAGEPGWLRRLRQSAIERFEELGFPTPRHEEWRFTNLAPFTRIAFRPAGPDSDGLTADSLRRLTPLGSGGPRLVFVNGHFVQELSDTHMLADGVQLGCLANFLKEPKRLEPFLGRHIRFQDHAFAALNTAFFRDGAVLYIPKGKVIREPIHLVFVATAPDGPSVCHPRNLIVVGTGGQATIVESYLSPANDTYFTNAVTEVAAGADSIIDHYKVQHESREAFHFATLQVHQDRASRFSSHFLSLGGGLVRNEVNAVLDAEGCECTLNGLYLATGRQHVDNHTVIDHAKPRCTSHEVYKGILNDQARGVFNGKIFVRQDAQKTDAKQTNKTLLLSQDATINTKPQLEIYADDVKCTHGATVGQLEEEALFYLRSRGIDAAAARSLLTFAFANDILSRVKVKPIRTWLEETLMASQGLENQRIQEAQA